MVAIAGSENIFVKLELISKGFIRDMKNANVSMQKFNKKISDQAHSLSRLSKKGKVTRINTKMNQIAQQGFFKTMRMGREEWKGFNEQGRKFTGIGGRMANSFRKSMHGMRGFRMEMLGVMFFGMMLQKTFSGLIKTSLDWMGVMDVFSVALGILFLPVAGLLLEWALKFLNWVSELTPEQKKLIGTFVLLGLAIGGLLFVIGSFALGIGSLILAFKFLFSPVGAILGLILALAGISIYGMFDDLTKEVDNAGQKIVGFGITGETLNKIREKIGMVITKVKDAIVENYPAILEKGKEILTKLVDGMVENKEKIADALEAMISAIGTWIGENASKLAELGLSIAGGIMRGLAKGFVDMVEGIGADIATWMTTETEGQIKARLLRQGKEGRIGRIPTFQGGGIMPHTGLAMLHSGERVTPANKVRGGVVLNVTYNVEVANNEEMERLLRDNNLQLVEEVKRQIAV